MLDPTVCRDVPDAADLDAGVDVGVHIVDLGGPRKQREQRNVRWETQEWSWLDWLRFFGKMRQNILGWFVIVFAVGVVAGKLL